MPSAVSMTPVQMEGTAAFYAGGLLTTLRMFLERGEEIQEEQFIDIIQSILSNG